MAVRAKTVSGAKRLDPKPKRTAQGHGRNSKPNHGRKQPVGQGR